MNNSQPFNPPRPINGPTMQSMLASSRLRLKNSHPMDDAAREVILDGGDGVRLMAYMAAQPRPTEKGLVVLLHGWEGSHLSVYNVRTARALYDHGFDVLRLNMRDHGPSHHLNKGLFLGTLIAEAHRAVISATELSQGPVFIAGWSMGGNFALRMSLRHAVEPIPRLARIAAISPAINPLRSTSTVDELWWARGYFMKKWKRSLRRKQELYPDLYDFSDVLKCLTVMGMTAKLLARYTEYGSCEEYFSQYDLQGDTLAGLAAPTSILTAADDPVIAVEDFAAAVLAPNADLIVTARGGHSGFVQDFSLSSWYEGWLPELFVQSRD